MKKHHIIYKTTCLATGKWYVGRHSTDNLNDGYLGSGKLILQSQKKHGSNAHVRETLLQCQSIEDAVLQEEKMITAEMLADPMCMNLKPGGEGGKGITWTTESKAKLSATLKGRPKTEEHKRKIAESNLGKNAGKRPTSEVRQKLSAAGKGKIKSAEHRANLGKAIAGKPKSDQHRQAIGEARRKAWAEWRAAKAALAQ